MKYINAQLKRKQSESWEELITTRKIIAKLTAEKLGNICISKIYDNNVYYTMFTIDIRSKKLRQKSWNITKLKDKAP